MLTQEAMMTPDEFMKFYEKATGSHDLEGTLRLIADDAIYFFSDTSSHVGKAAIRDVLVRNFDSIRNETYRLSDLRWLAANGDVAACVYEFHWSGEIGGEPRSGSGRGTSVLCRVETSWVVVHEHLSAGKI
jgi:ketosteroid isomerase-like protein